jgi:polar amino acid transport system substrate-binding protein
VASKDLVKSGQLSFCADITSPPLTYYDAAQKPLGAEVDLGNAIAAQLGLKPVWVNTAFAGIIPALQAKHCDAVLSQLFIKPARLKVVDMVPYMYSSNTLLVQAGKDKGISDATTLCGHKAAGETGTTIIDYLQTASAACKTAGKPAIAISQFAKDTEAFQQLKLGLVDAYGTTLETAAYAIKQQPGAFALVGQPFNKIKTGIATRKDDTGLRDKISSALTALQGNGKYAAILKQWNLSGDDISAS